MAAREPREYRFTPALLTLPMVEHYLGGVSHDFVYRLWRNEELIPSP